VKVLRGQDAVISAIGATGFQSQKTVIDAAIAAGVRRFLPSEFSANTLSDAVRSLVPAFVPKMEILDYLKEKGSTGLTWTGLAVGALLDDLSSG
jgi:DNA-binding NarL/FixJ family response regulator